MAVCPNGCGINHREGPTPTNCPNYSAHSRKKNASSASSSLGSKSFRGPKRSARKTVDDIRAERASYTGSISDAVASNKSALLSDDDYYSDDHVMEYADSKGWTAERTTGDSNEMTLYMDTMEDSWDLEKLSSMPREEFSAHSSDAYGVPIENLELEYLDKNHDEYDPNVANTKINGAEQVKITGPSGSIMNYMAGMKKVEDGQNDLAGRSIQTHDTAQYERDLDELDSPRRGTSRVRGDDGPGDDHEEMRLRQRG